MVGVPIAAATCIRPESFEIATPAAAIARMPLRKSLPVRSRTRGPPAATISAASAFSPGPPTTQTSRPCCGQKPRGLRVVGPAFGGADRARRQRHGGIAAEPVGLPPAVDFVGRNPKLRHRPFRRQRRAVRQRQRGVLVDQAGQGLFAPAPLVEQPKPGFADETHPFRNAGQRRRNRRFPGPGHDQRGAVVPGAEPPRQPPLLGERQPAARQVPDDAGRARPACNRPAERRARWSAGRPGGSASAAFRTRTTVWPRTKSPIHI